MQVKVKNKTPRTLNLASGPLYPFQEGFASQAEASNMSAVLEWIQDEPEKKGPGRPRKEDSGDE
jgi:hypothetical protein